MQTTTTFPRAIGVSHDADAPQGRGVLVSFERPLTDDELRTLHAALASPVSTGIAGEPKSGTPEGRIKELETMLRCALAETEALEADLEKARAAVPAQPTQPQTGMVLAPHYRGYAHLGTGQYMLNHSGAGQPAEFIVSVATHEEKAGRTVGDLRATKLDSILLPEAMAVRIRFENVAGLDAMEQQLRLLRAEHFPAESVAAQPQQVEGAAPTDLTGSIRPSAEPARQRNADALAMLKYVLPYINPRSIDLAKARTGPTDYAYVNTIVRRFIESAEHTKLPAGTAGCSPAESVESTLSPEPAKVGGAGECQGMLTVCPTCNNDMSKCALTAKASGVQAADLAGLKLWQSIEIRDDFPVRHETFYRAADVEALFNPAPTGETK